MLALGLQGSPRKKGNSDILLTRFMNKLADDGFCTQILEVARSNIEPCREITLCEKKGYCPIEDDMAEVYGLLRKADVVVAASPVFFYGVTAQLKALIDRCQTLWARRYRLKLKDPGYHIRRGYILAVGATSGKQLFEGIHLTARYFYDGISADYMGSLTYRRIEGRGRIKEQPNLDEEIGRAAEELARGLNRRRKVLFICRDNAAAGPMAAAFTRFYAGDRFDAFSAGIQPAGQVEPLMIEAMAEKGIDMAFHATTALDIAMTEQQPDDLITLDCACPDDLPDDLKDRCRTWEEMPAADGSLEAMRRMRDEIEQRVNTMLGV